ncbi:aconitase family protein [Clostridiales bacterium 1_7_47FAA]|uniref:Hydratase n=1 Tax=Enterocloster hominis (ex Hitch et al. 2024) TaxID=1917870 RepID=A0ABV1D1E0_9FIRM|nr:aconitase family protein [Clostridiales bacterium 1_7_47FAA]
MKLYDSGVFLLEGETVVGENEAPRELLEKKEQYKEGTISYGILQDHNTGTSKENLKIRFDAITSHDLTYVGIIQTARASGMERFPIPYVLTCCHNSLCAVGGTINEDDHVFGLTAAKKYGGIYLPPHMGVIHQYMRETEAGCGKMILGSDSHTRYGAIGTMAVGEGGGELVKQILEETWDIKYPEVIAVYLDGKPNPGVGPQDIAIAIVTAVFKNGYVKNKVMEFVGPGVSSMSTDYRNGIDVMTTETTCLSSIWRTDEDTKKYLAAHGRGGEYKKLEPQKIAYYEGCIYIDLSAIHSMIALPFHPSNGYEIRVLNENLDDILHEVEENAKKLIKNPELQLNLRGKIHDGALYADQGTIAGCSGGTYSNIMEAAYLLENKSTGNDAFNLSVYPSSQAVMMDLLRKGAIETLTAAGATIRTAFCGPCFGAGDTPAHGQFAVRHTTRNFPNREGSKPGNGQIASVALMDARSVAATSANRGRITAADELGYVYECPEYHYDSKVYANRVYQGFGKGNPEEELICGPNIKAWPQLPELNENMLLKVCAYITDPVTTTDELIPSGETGSFRSNPMGLAEFTLSRRAPEYVGKAKAVMNNEKARKEGNCPEEIREILDKIHTIPGYEKVEDESIDLSSTIYAVKPGDGSAREQAASCQRVLLGGANISVEYATKRYRSNLINWGMVPFILNDPAGFSEDDYIFVPDIKKALNTDMKEITAFIIGDKIRKLSLAIEPLTEEEKEIIRCGSLINYNRKHNSVQLQQEEI